jgi:DNA-binding MarR family transcriptional regulator
MPKKKPSTPRASAIQRTRRSIDRRSYIPFLLNVVANAISSRASRVYLLRYGIGINEWRILSILAYEGVCTAALICEQIHLDAGAASRNIQALEKRGYIDKFADPNDGRSFKLTLTKQGAELHDKAVEVALTLQEQLLTGFSDDDASIMRELLHRLIANVAQIYSDQADIDNGGAAITPPMSKARRRTKYASAQSSRRRSAGGGKA